MVIGRGLLMCLFWAAAFLVCTTVRAQVSAGTLSGTVSDSSGSGIPQAQLVIKNVATAVERTVTTNDDGFYNAMNLPAGSYEVTISAKDFSTEIKSGITVTVGGQQTFDVVMHVGTVASRVEVTTQVPTVQLASSDISAVVDATTVRELPLNGRSWTDLAALQPGVSTIQTQPSFTSGSDPRHHGSGLLGLQKQSHQAHLRKLQHPIPGRNVQHSESSKLLRLQGPVTATPISLTRRELRWRLPLPIREVPWVCWSVQRFRSGRFSLRSKLSSSPSGPDNFIAVQF